MAQSIEELDFSNYDIIIASSSAFAHGAISKPESTFFVYYHAPARYLWDRTNEYKNDIGWNKWIKSFIINKLFLHLRQWDFFASKRSDIQVANSATTQKRIQKFFKKNIPVIYPPIETERFNKNIKQHTSTPFHSQKYYIILSALSEFKKIDIAIKAFKNFPEKNLLIIGKGEYKKSLEILAENKKNILFAGAKYGDELVSLVQQSDGLIFPWEEDFGIVPIEFMAAGKPVFALKKWWLLESVIEGKTWDFFEHPDGSDFEENFKIFDSRVQNNYYSADDCKNRAEQFNEKNFEKAIKNALGL